METHVDSHLQRGDSVILQGHYAGQRADGGLSEIVRCRDEWLVKVSDTGLTEFEAMAIGTAGFTAMQCIDALERNGLSKDNGTQVIVTGATGGVGSFAVAILAGKKEG